MVILHILLTLSKKTFAAKDDNPENVVVYYFCKMIWMDLIFGASTQQNQLVQNMMFKKLWIYKVLVKY